MKKIIITETQLNVIKSHLLEKIEPNKAFNNTDAMSTLLNGERNIGFLVTYDDESKKLLRHMLENGFKTIPIKQKNDIYSVGNVIYNTNYEGDATKLANIAKKFDGFLPSDNKVFKNVTYMDVYNIGILLGYNENSVINFVKSKFGNDVFNTN
jgi:hypothetical protein